MASEMPDAESCQGHSLPTTRRDLFALGGLSLLAAATSGSTAKAASAPLTDREQANIKLVKQFIKTCSEKPFNIEKLVGTYFAANAAVRWADDLPPAIGTAAAIAAGKALMPDGTWIEIKLLDIFARGQLVATSRIDIIKAPGKPDMPFDIAGVHIIKDGKFIEYIDYIVK